LDCFVSLGLFVFEVRSAVLLRPSLAALLAGLALLRCRSREQMVRVPLAWGSLQQMLFDAKARSVGKLAEMIDLGVGRRFYRILGMEFLSCSSGDRFLPVQLWCSVWSGVLPPLLVRGLGC
jgi:hypothetical protein